jgi:hypothetical protein
MSSEGVKPLPIRRSPVRAASAQDEDADEFAVRILKARQRNIFPPERDRESRTEQIRSGSNRNRQPLRPTHLQNYGLQIPAERLPWALAREMARYAPIGFNSQQIPWDVPAPDVGACSLKTFAAGAANRA